MSLVQTTPIWWKAVSIAGVLAVVALALNLWLHLRWFLAVPVFLFEGAGRRRALRRSAELVRGHLRFTFLLILGCTVIPLAISGPAFQGFRLFAGGLLALVAGERIPTRRQVIDLARGKVLLSIELKDNGHDERLAERVVQVLREEEFTDRGFVMSLNAEGLREARRIDPGLRLGYIVFQAFGRLDAMDVEVISAGTGQATPAFVRWMHAAGKEVHVWAVNDPAGMERHLDLGVDGILTDDPARLRKLLDERASLSSIERLLLRFRRWLGAGGAPPNPAAD